MRKSISQIVGELDQLQMQGVALTYRQKQQIAQNENVIKGKMSVQDAYMENVSRRTQPVFETVPEQNNALVKLKSGGSLPKMQDAGALMVQTDPVDEPTPEIVVDPVKPSTEDYRNSIQSNYKNILANDYKTPYIKGVTEGGMNCINGVCSLIKKAGAKKFTRNTYTGNATFNDNLENEGYYTIDPTKEAFEIGDIVQYSRKKSRAQRFGGTTNFVTGEELFPQHAKIIADKYVDKDGVTQYVIVHNYGEEKLSKKEISEAELLSHTKGYGSGVKYMDGLLVQRYGPDVVAKSIEEREAKEKILQGQNEFAKEYNVPVTNISFSKPMQTVEGETYNKRVNKDLSQIYTQNYDKLAKMSDVPKSTFDQMLALQVGIQHMESGKGGLRAAAKSVITTATPFLLDEARRITSDPDEGTWVDVYWKDNAEDVKEKFKTKEDFIKYLNKDNKLSQDAREWAYYNSPPSKGAFQQKELSDRGRFLNIDPNLESYEDQAIASLALMIDNYHRVKKQYPEATEEELLDLSTLMHNAPSKALTPEFYRYFVKNKDVNYVNDVKRFVPTINIDQAQTRELPQEEIDAMKGFIDGLSDAGPQMRYGGSLPALPKYQDGTPTAADSARVYKSYLDFKSAVESSPYEYRQMSGGEKSRVSGGERIDAIVNTALPVQEIDSRIKPKSITPFISDRKPFLAGHPDFKLNENIANTFKGKIGKYLPSGHRDAVMLHDYSNLAPSIKINDLSERDFPTPDQINNMSSRPSPTLTPTLTPPPTKTLNNIEEISGKIVNKDTGESWTKEEWEALKGKGSFGKARQKARMQYGGSLPKYQDGTNSFPQVTDKYGNKGTRVKVISDIDQDTGQAYAAYAPLHSLPEATATAELDRTNPNAVRNWSKKHDPIAYAAREATDKFASNYLMPVAEMAPGTGDVMDVANFGNAVYKGDYGTAALYAGFGLLPGSATPLVKGAKKLGRGIKNAYQEAIYRGVEPLEYGFREKVKSFVPNLIRNSRRTPEERALDIGYNWKNASGSKKNVPRTEEEITQDIKDFVTDGGKEPLTITQPKIDGLIYGAQKKGTDLLDAWNMGLRRKQNWDTFEKLGEDVYRINPDKKLSRNMGYFDENPLQETDMFGSIGRHFREVTGHKQVMKQFRETLDDMGETFNQKMLSDYGLSPPSNTSIGPKTKGAHFEPGKNRYHLKQDLIRGNYTMDVKTTPGGPMTFTAIDKWDLNPFRNKKNMGPLKDLELLKLAGGKPYTIKNTYDVNPRTFDLMKSYKNGGYLSRYRKRK